MKIIHKLIDLYRAYQIRRIDPRILARRERINREYRQSVRGA